MPETPTRRAEAAGNLRILWSGRVEPRKALSLLIEAVALLPADVNWQVRVLGDGPMLRKCRRRAQQLGIDDRIKWLGWLPHRAAIEQLQWADVFAFTSLRDTCGTVLLESLSEGLPVVCLDHQGAADVITPACGIKVPVIDPRQVVRSLSEAFIRLGSDPNLRARLGEGARQRAAKYAWSRLGEQMADVYRRVLEDCGSDARPHERGAMPIESPFESDAALVR